MGVAGAPPGSAVESNVLLEPASVSVGTGIDAERVYGGLESVQWEVR